MRVIVTGGAGFIGQHLCAQLLRTGAKRIIVIDDFSTPAPTINESPSIQYINRDVRMFPAFEWDADILYHLACPASPVHYQKDPIKTLETAFTGTHNVLHWAACNKRKVIIASTSEVYGTPHVHPQPESYWGNVNPFGPRAVYDEGKRAAEALVWAYLQMHHIDVRVARIFNSYGSNMRTDDGRAIPNFITQALNNQPITVYGDGTQTRSFCYVDDLIDGLLALAKYTGDHRVFNLGNPHECSVGEIAERILKLIGSKADIVHKSLPVDDPTIRCPDITRALTCLDWAPKIDLDEGLRRTIDYFRTHAVLVSQVHALVPG